MSTHRAVAPIKIVLAIALLMALLLATGCMAIQNQRFDADKAKKQARFVIETKLPKDELLTKLVSSAKAVFKTVNAEIQENAGMITGRYVSAKGRYKNFSAEQTVGFTLRLQGENNVLIEFQADGYVPADVMPTTMSRRVLLDRSAAAAEAAEEAQTKQRKETEKQSGEEDLTPALLPSKKTDFFYQNASELQASWRKFAVKLAQNILADDIKAGNMEGRKLARYKDE